MIRTRLSSRPPRAARLATGLVALAAAGLALALAPAEPTVAQASRTWVSGVGEDNNPCSRAAPCKTFAGAISKTASGGEINALDPGGFGAVTITKPITIDGTGTYASILASGTNGVIVNAPAGATVVLRGLSINGGTSGFNGIRYLAGGALHVEDVIIERFTGGNGRGIDMQVSASSALYVSNTTIRNNAGAAIYASGAGQATISVDDSRLQNNGAGLDARNNTGVTVRDTRITGNAGPGVQARPDAGSSEVNADRLLLAFNATGIQSGGGAQPALARLSGSTIVNNATGVATAAGSATLSAGNNRLVGNGTDGAFSAAVGTPPPAPSAPACAQRPPVTIQTVADGPGRLRVTVTANTTPAVTGATNTLLALRFGTATNATVVGGSVPVGSPTGRNVAMPGNTTTTTFTLQRATPGQAFTVPFTVRDGCGDWPTFVGGGPSAP